MEPDVFALCGSLIGALDLHIRRAGCFSMLCSLRNVAQVLSFQRNPAVAIPE